MWIAHENKAPMTTKETPMTLTTRVQNDMYELWRWTTFPRSGKKQKRKRISQKLESRNDGNTMVWCPRKFHVYQSAWKLKCTDKCKWRFFFFLYMWTCIQQALLSSTRQKFTVLPCDTSSIDCVSWTNVFIISFLVIPTLLLETLSKANVIEAKVQKPRRHDEVDVLGKSTYTNQSRSWTVSTNTDTNFFLNKRWYIF